MVGWHHWLNGHEFDQILGDDEGQGRLAWCSPWGCKESDTTEQQQQPSIRNNARLQVSLITSKKMLQLSWEVLIHLLCWLDITPSNFHLFQSLQNCLNGKNFNSLEDCKKEPETVLCPKRKKICVRWNYEVAQKMAEGNNEYVVQWNLWWKWKICLLCLLKNQSNFLANPIHT